VSPKESVQEVVISAKKLVLLMDTRYRTTGACGLEDAWRRHDSFQIHEGPRSGLVQVFSSKVKSGQAVEMIAVAELGEPVKTAVN
jgi:hypothetical protein